jgi:hypothetical protein
MMLINLRSPKGTKVFVRRVQRIQIINKSLVYSKSRSLFNILNYSQKDIYHLLEI